MTEIVEIAVIGGSGLYNMPEISAKSRQSMDTPFGKPSDDIVIGTLHGKRVAFLARHGAGHVHSPASIPQRANIYALKALGVRFIIAVNACGSLREVYAPGHIVIPDQLFDYNIGIRERSFFDEGLVAHVSVADPYDAYLRALCVTAVQAQGGTAHDGGLFIIEDGPRFATRGESKVFRQWGCDIIGMTTAPEAFLAREAEIAYVTVAHITDYDSWHETTEAVTSDMVIAQLHKNIDLVQRAVSTAIQNLDLSTISPAHNVLDYALTTDRAKMYPSEIEKLYPIVKRALKLT